MVDGVCRLRMGEGWPVEAAAIAAPAEPTGRGGMTPAARRAGVKLLVVSFAFRFVHVNGCDFGLRYLANFVFRRLP